MILCLVCLEVRELMSWVFMENFRVELVYTYTHIHMCIDDANTRVDFIRVLPFHSLLQIVHSLDGTD